MFDCMEALGLAPRPLYDVSAQGSCMLSKATPFFSSLDPFAWAGTGSLQCELPGPSPSFRPITSIIGGGYHGRSHPQEETDSTQCSVSVLTPAVRLLICSGGGRGGTYTHLYIIVFVAFANDLT